MLLTKTDAYNSSVFVFEKVLVVFLERFHNGKFSSDKFSKKRLCNELTPRWFAAPLVTTRSVDLSTTETEKN